MLDSPFKASSSKNDKRISFTCFTAAVDLEYSLDRIFGALDKVLIILHWPQEKIMEEIRRGFIARYFESDKKVQETPFSLYPFFYHVYVDQPEDAILFFVPKNQHFSFPEGINKEDFEKLGLPVFSFCYR